VDGGVTNVCPTFSLTISATDNVSVSITQWTLDSTWASWTNFSGSGPSYTASLTSGTSGMPASGPVSLWVRAIDPCGNATIQELDLNVLCSTPANTATN